MPSEPKRKLAAIMFTDMVGYTALMQEDEDKARELIQRHRELMKPIIEKYNGEILQYVGDGTFCSFESAIESANCAVEIQKGFKTDKEISLRIGIHVGDVVIDGDEVYGDGVNVASRLEPLSAPGGVNISGRVYDDLKNHKDISVESLGEIKLKNVKDLMPVYALSGKDLVVSKLPDSDYGGVTERELPKPASKKLFPWVGGAVVLLILFFARGWFAGESSITEVTADENSLAVMFIENMTDPTDADKSAEMIRMLLSTDLSQAQSLRVVSTQRLFDIAKQKRKKNEILIDRFNATSVAKQARARWMLTGTFSRVGSRLLLITELEDVWEGKIIHSQRADGDDLFSLVDALSSEIRSDMGVITSAGEIDAPVREITTNSSVAYQKYLEGLEFLNESNFGEAIEMFNRAVEIDSTFTKALYKLAVAQWWFETGNDLRAKETVKKILLNKESLAEGELLLVQGLEAQLYDDRSQAIDIYQRLLLMYPDDKEIHYGLGEAYYHSSVGEQLKALSAFEEAIDLDPDFALVYVHIFEIYQRERMDNRAIRIANRLVDSNPDKAIGYRYLADVYGWKGELDKSIRNYEKASELNRGIHESVALHGWAHRIQGKYDKALSNYAELFKPDVPAIWQFRGKMISGFVYAEQGQYEKAIQLLGEARRIERPINKLEIILNMAFLANSYSSIGDTAGALSLLDSAIAIKPSIDAQRYLYWQKGRLYAGSGNQKELKKLINAAKIATKQTGDVIRWNILNNIELLRLQGAVEKALVEYDKLDPLSHSSGLDVKANLYSDARDWENVILTANEMQASFFPSFILSDSRSRNYPRAFYYRGIAYEKMGKPELAIENYEALLELWKDADEEIPERRDTIKRLAALKQGS